MAWTTPKTDWASNDGIAAADFNRIEGNCEYLKDFNGGESYGSFTVSLLGYASSHSLTIGYHLSRSLYTGGPRIATLVWPQFWYDDSNDEGLYCAAGSVPSNLRPYVNIVSIFQSSLSPVIVINDGGGYLGNVEIFEDGSITWCLMRPIYRDVARSGSPDILLTDSSGGTPSNTIGADIEDNFASLARHANRLMLNLVNLDLEDSETAKGCMDAIIQYPVYPAS